MTPSIEQDKILKSVSVWFKSKSKPFLYLGGPAGSGKSSLARLFAENIPNVCYGAYTGKAAMVMRKYGCLNAQTLHSLIYKPIVDPVTGECEFILNNNSPLKKSKLIIVDEVSMVNKQLAEDLLSFGIPVLVLGDPYQLPPVSGTGYFTRGKPDLVLTEIHRQALDNPIIQMATDVRAKKRLKIGKYGSSKVCLQSDISDEQLNASDQIIVGIHSSRKSLNSSIREMRGYLGIFPCSGEKLICTKNNKDNGLFNGGQYECISDKRMNSNFIREIKIKSLDFESDIITQTKYNVACFEGNIDEVDWRFKKGLDQFDYSYALTCHKSQGSQWNNTIVIDESACFRSDASKWLYTAITRACESTIIGLDQ